MILLTYFIEIRTTLPQSPLRVRLTEVNFKSKKTYEFIFTFRYIFQSACRKFTGHRATTRARLMHPKSEYISKFMLFYGFKTDESGGGLDPPKEDPPKIPGEPGLIPK